MTLQKNRGAVRRFAKVMKFGHWLADLPNKLTPPPFRLIQIGSAFWQSRALAAAAQLDIATRLGDGRKSAEAIAQEVEADAEAVYRLLRFLVSLGVFEEVAPRVFANNKLSTPLRTDLPNSVRPMILMHNSAPMSAPWYERLEEGIRSGEPPFALAHGQELFDYMGAHPDFEALFGQAMGSVEALTGDSFATDFDWGRFESLIDVGGSRGDKAVAILKHHPGLKALVFDRPEAVAGAAEYWAANEAALSPRLSFEGGDAREQVPTAQSDREVYLLSAVLHGFDDGAAGRILSSVAAGCGATGARIAILEMVLPEQGADQAGASFDMQMFMGTRGKERTLSQWQALLEANGLKLEEVVGLQTLPKILVARAKG